MGHFYKNITLRGPSREQILDELRSQGMRAFVSPAEGVDVVMCDQFSDASGDPEPLGDLAATLTLKFGCIALAVANYDDDLLLVGLFDRGERILEYTNWGPRGGAWGLCWAFGRKTAIMPVWIALHMPTLFQFLRHLMLVKILRLPRSAVGFGFQYMKQGEAPLDYRIEDFTETGGAA